jgi:RNA polymerase sigma factor (sigma-70 family)
MPNLASVVFNKPAHDFAGIRCHHRDADAELIKQCLTGDDQAWTALLERYGNLIYSIALKAGLSSDDAADVFQSVCLAMLNGLEQVNDASRLGSWVATITRRHIYRIWEQQGHSGLIPDCEEQELANQPDHAPLPDELMEQLEEERMLRQAVSMLDDPCRQLVTALFYEDEPKSYEQLAQEMGLSASTLGPKRGRCLRRIRRILEDNQF